MNFRLVEYQIHPILEILAYNPTKAFTFFVNIISNHVIIIYLARSLYDSTPGQMAFDGVPNIRNIRYIWSISESPLKRALRVAISDMIAPTAHISTGVE